jgi:hypothetical protein
MSYIPATKVASEKNNGVRLKKILYVETYECSIKKALSLSNMEEILHVALQI